MTSLETYNDFSQATTSFARQVKGGNREWTPIQKDFINLFVARFLHSGCFSALQNLWCPDCAKSSLWTLSWCLRACSRLPFLQAFYPGCAWEVTKVWYNLEIPGNHSIRWMKQGSLAESVQSLPSLASYIKHFFDYSILHSSYSSLLSKRLRLCFI